jgi:1,5-anhydro-D-fructose reductase (1,5-anhydro-D-mannitol-forming)
MAKVGIVGLGFMGKMHFRCYKSMSNVDLVAVCDVEQSRFSDSSGTAGNIAGAEQPLDFEGITTYTDFDKMLEEADLDAVSITLPTYLHCEYTVKALNAGLDVLCEKPMAMTVDQCSQMIAAAQKSGKYLQIGHCLRFWPEYVKTKEIIDSGKYGPVISATFQRLSMTPTWSWENWLLDGQKSGGAAQDLHIHDTDTVQFFFDMPDAIYSQGYKGVSKDYDHMVTNYIFENKNITVLAEGGWSLPASFGFEMSFNIAMEKAMICFDITRDPIYKVCPADGDAFTPELPAGGDGYERELDYFAKKINGQDLPEIITPQQSLNSVAILLAEKESAKKQKTVKL